METMDDVLILGGGPAGCTAALYAARSALKTRILEKLAPGGQMATTDHIDNYPGFPEGIEGYALGSRMEQQAVQFGAQITVGEAVGVSLEGKVKTVEIADGTLLKARAVIVAPGASPRELGLPKEAEFRGRGVSYCATCDGAFYRGKRVAVVGGGDTAAVRTVFIPDLPAGDFGSPAGGDAGCQSLSPAFGGGGKRGVCLEQRGNGFDGGG